MVTGDAEATESIVTFRPAGEVWKVTGISVLKLADAIFPVPPLVDDTAPVTLLYVPPALAVTLTLNMHDALAASVAPARLTLPPAAVAVMVPPPQAPVRPFGVDTVMPAGSVSVKATPVRELVPFGLPTAKVRLVEPARGMVGAPNALEMLGGASVLRLADAVFPAPPFVDVTALVVLA
jgi:hypothetical protein